MARNVGTVLFNNFSGGWITEATSLNFPDNAVTDSLNVDFNRTGGVQRREGFDREPRGQDLPVSYEGFQGVLKEHLWRSVGKQGGFTLVVVQIGPWVYFFQPDIEGAVSSGVLPQRLDLRKYTVAGGIFNSGAACSMSSGAGFLFVTHPDCRPLLVRREEGQLQVSPVRLLIRDFEGVPDNLKVDEHPTTLTKEHLYNLKNQSWFTKVRVGARSNEIGQSTLPDSAPDHPLDFTDIGD